MHFVGTMETKHKQAPLPPNGTRVYELELIDGMGPEKATMRSGPVAGLAECRNHCAHHGSSVFHCCRCGSTFTRLADGRKLVIR